jgi:pimeloyl-ACP methyl ester carboxylesterase
MRLNYSSAIRKSFLIVVLLHTASLISCSRQTDVNAPAESGFAEIGAVRLYYEITGDGEPLLLLHGGLGGSEHFAEIVPLLSKSFEVITVDRRGHGRSTDDGEPYSYAGMAEEMRAFLDHLQLGSVKMLGFSDGGVVGFHLASTYPEMVERLVAVGANFRVDGMTPETVDFMTNQMTPENLGKVFPEVERAYRATNPQPDNYASFIERSQAMWTRDPYLTEQQMTGIKVPVLSIIGEHDAIRLEHALEMRSLNAGSQICVLPGATHFLLGEKPEVVLPILLDFFAS